MQLDTEGNRVRVTGSVMYYYDYTGHINIIKRYISYFTISDAPQMDFLRFDELNVK